MLSGEPRIRRRTIVCLVAVVACTLGAPLASWSAGHAQGATAQTITFGPLPDRTMSDPALLVTASATSGLPVTFTTTTPEVCTKSGTNGATISPEAPGVCTVQADQAGDVTFAAAPLVRRSFTVTKASQTIDFPALPDRDLALGAFVVSASATTGFPVTFTTTTPAVCTATGTHGTIITPQIAGTCTVRADQSGNAIFDAAPPVTQSFGVSKGSQAITFGALTDKSVLQSPVTVSATSTALLPVTFTSTTPAVCTSGGVNGATITLVGAGVCTVQADQAGSDTVSAAAPVTRSFTVTKVDQSITFDALAGRTALQSPLTVGATSSSTLAVTFTTTTPAVCTSGGTRGTVITLAGSGTCTVKADQAGNTVYAAAASVFQSFTVTKADQTITFGALADRNALQSPLTVSATASSPLTVSFTSTTPAVCTSGGTNGTTITLVTLGTCTIAADQAGNAIYKAAATANQSFAVTKVDQTITFGTLADVPLGPAIAVGATASSGLAVTFSTTTPAVCTASANMISVISVGTCTVHSDQAGNAIYNPAPTVSRNFGVGKTNQTIAFAALPTVSVTHAPITVSASSSSALPVAFTTSPPTVCTATGSNGETLTIVGAGTCTVTADQTGNGFYNAAPSVVRTFTVTKVAQTITFASIAGVPLAKANITVSATASSSLGVIFTSTTPTICKTGGTAGAKVVLLKAGTCGVRADQAGNATFAPAVPVTRMFAVTTPVVATQKSGYWMLGSDGHVYAFGSATNFGSAGAPAVAFAARRDGAGYWVVDRFGDVRAFGQAVYHGGRPALNPGESVSTIAATPSGNGYWLFTSTGRAFAYGDAHFFGDMRAVHLNGPVVASVATPTGRGYFMVGSDGGVFTFGDARFHGSMGGAHLNQPIVGLSPTPDNRGYWLVASDGGVFAFGAPFRGSLGKVSLNKSVNGLVAYGNGYLMVASDGGVFNFSNRAFVGSLGSSPPAAPIVGIATNTSP